MSPERPEERANAAAARRAGADRAENIASLSYLS